LEIIFDILHITVPNTRRITTMMTMRIIIKIA
jgi:hypothetical protein